MIEPSRRPCLKRAHVKRAILHNLYVIVTCMGLVMFTRGENEHDAVAMVVCGVE